MFKIGDCAKLKTDISYFRIKHDKVYIVSNVINGSNGLLLEFEEFPTAQYKACNFINCSSNNFSSSSSSSSNSFVESLDKPVFENFAKYQLFEVNKNNKYFYIKSFSTEEEINNYISKIDVDINLVVYVFNENINIKYSPIITRNK